MKGFKFIATALLALTLTACGGCSGLSTRQKVAVSCETAASALDTLTAGKQAGKITAAQLTEAIAVYESAVVPFCVPVAQDMTAVEQAALAVAIAKLTSRAGALENTP